jgi:hypothetical protein
LLALQEPLAGGALFQVDQAASPHQDFPRDFRKRVKTQIWIAISVYVLVAIIKKRLHLTASLHTLLQILSVILFEKLDLAEALTPMLADEKLPFIDNQLILLNF